MIDKGESMADLDAFRADVRDWLEANCPEEMRQPIQDEEDVVWGGKTFNFTEPQKLWLDRMAEKGWTVPEWPVEYGGGGLDKAHAKVLREEMRKIGARAPVQSLESGCSGRRF